MPTDCKTYLMHTDILSSESQLSVRSIKIKVQYLLLTFKIKNKISSLQKHIYALYAFSQKRF